MGKFEIGDEVTFVDNDAIKFVITCVHKDGSLAGIGRDGIAFVDKNPEKWAKTGRYFPEAVAFMNALNDQERNGQKYDDDLIHKINDALFAAVNHGGDPGGAYFCFPKELKKAIDSLAEKLCITWEWRKPQREDYPVLKDYDGNPFEIPEQYREWL